MIGIFDSGLGGLTVLKKLIEKLPDYDYMYLGDNARAPYGNKSQDVIYNYTREAIDFLFRKGCKLVIIACNTASAKALRKIQQEWLLTIYPERRVLGVLIPAAEVAVEELMKIKSRGEPKKIGIIGTRATIESKTYDQELEKIIKEKDSDLRIEIFSQASPLLVPLIEEGWLKQRETKMILKKYLRPLKDKHVNALILGCTHYPFLFKEIKQIMGKQVEVIDTPSAVAVKLKDYLKRHKEIDQKLSKNKKRIFYTTDEEKKFKEFAKNLIRGEINKVNKTEI